MEIKRSEQQLDLVIQDASNQNLNPKYEINDIKEFLKNFIRELSLIKKQLQIDEAKFTTIAEHTVDARVILIGFLVKKIEALRTKMSPILDELQGHPDWTTNVEKDRPLREAVEALTAWIENMKSYNAYEKESGDTKTNYAFPVAITNLDHMQIELQKIKFHEERSHN